MTTDRLTVQVTVSVPVSRHAWWLNYGVSGTAAIRRDVKSHVTDSVIDHLQNLGLLADDGEED